MDDFHLLQKDYNQELIFSGYQNVNVVEKLHGKNG